MPATNGVIAALSIVLVEDIRILRDGMADMLRAEGLRVVAAIRSGEDAIRRILSARPRIVMLDSALGDHDAPRFAAAVASAAPEAKLVVMDMQPAQADVIDFIRAGARGFILRDATAADVVGTLRAVASGMAVLPPRLTGVLFSYVSRQGVPRDAAARGSRLTHREREIIQLIADGATNKEIAVRLNIAVHTVKSHVHSVLEKLTLHSRLQIARYAHVGARGQPAVAADLRQLI